MSSPEKETRMIAFRNLPDSRVGNFLAGASVASMIGGTAVAVTSTSFTYSTARKGYYTIPASAMVPNNYRSAEVYFNEPLFLGSPNASGILTYSGTSETFCFQTGVNLPQSATIVNVATFYKSNAQSDVVVKFIRHTLANNSTGAFLIDDQIEDNSGTRRAITHVIPAALRTVNNALYSYTYLSCLGDGSNFESARIYYTYSSAGD
jgi:hypothetical protein